MKIPLLILSALCMAMSAAAAPQEATLHHTDGSMTRLVFSEQFKVTCPDSETLRFTDGKGTDIELAHSDIHHVSYNGDTTFITTVESTPQVSINGRQLTLGNIAGSPDIKVYDMSGRMLTSRPGDTETVIDFSEFPTGTYIVSAGKLRLKITI